MRRYLLLAAGAASAIALTAGVSFAGAPPSPPHYGHWTHCTTDVQGTTQFDQWQQVHMVLGAGGDTFWIDSPTSWTGHYLIQRYRFVYADPNVLPTSGWSDWITKGAKTGPSDKSLVIECMGSFVDATPPYWVDSIDVLAPAK